MLGNISSPHRFTADIYYNDSNYIKYTNNSPGKP